MRRLPIAIFSLHSQRWRKRVVFLFSGVCLGAAWLKVETATGRLVSQNGSRLVNRMPANTYHKGHVPDMLMSQGSMQTGWYW